MLKYENLLELNQLRNNQISHIQMAWTFRKDKVEIVTESWNKRYEDSRTQGKQKCKEIRTSEDAMSRGKQEHIE